jgi:hypothetical protein
MKIILVISAIIASAASASAVQVITCSMSGSDSKDQVVVTLQNDQTGKFLYKTVEQGASGTTQDQGTLPLKRAVSNDKLLATFEVQSQVMQMTFQMPIETLFTNSPGFKGKLLTRIVSMELEEEQLLQCSSKI